MSEDPATAGLSARDNIQSSVLSIRPSSLRTSFIDNTYTLSYNLGVKIHSWDPEKDQLLKLSRGVSFTQIIEAVSNNQLVDIIQNPTRPHQKIYIVQLNNYIYAVPFVEDDQKIFLKTIIPNRKLTKKYLHKKI